MASLLRTTAQGPAFFVGVFTSTGNVGGRPSSVTPSPPGYMGGWGLGSQGGWGLGQSKSQGGLVTPPPPLPRSITKQRPGDGVAGARLSAYCTARLPPPVQCPAGALQGPPDRAAPCNLQGGGAPGGATPRFWTPTTPPTVTVGRRPLGGGVQGGAIGGGGGGGLREGRWGGSRWCRAAGGMQSNAMQGMGSYGLHSAGQCRALKGRGGGGGGVGKRSGGGAVCRWAPAGVCVLIAARWPPMGALPPPPTPNRCPASPPSPIGALSPSPPPPPPPAAVSLAQRYLWCCVDYRRASLSCAAVPQPCTRGGGGCMSVCLFFFFVKGAHGNVTEERFVLTLLLCSLGPCSVKVSIQHLDPTAGCMWCQ